MSIMLPSDDGRGSPTDTNATLAPSPGPEDQRSCGLKWNVGVLACPIHVDHRRTYKTRSITAGPSWTCVCRPKVSIC